MKRATWLLLSVFIILLDQFTKFEITQHLHGSEVIRLAPFLNFVTRYNAGAAFSFLGQESGWQIYFFSIVSALISVGILIWLFRLKPNDRVTAAALSLILGGAAGNLIDRVRFGFVTDFIDFHIHHWHYATFNVADSAVCIGVVMLVLRVIFRRE